MAKRPLAAGVAGGELPVGDPSSCEAVKPPEALTHGYVHFLGSGPAGNDDLWYRHIPGMLRFLFFIYLCLFFFIKNHDNIRFKLIQNVIISSGLYLCYQPEPRKITWF